MTHIFSSKAFKVSLLIVLILVLLLDLFSLWAVFINNAPVAVFLKVFMLLGFSLKLWILFSLISKSGPIKVLLNIWGGLFAFSGVTGLLAFVVSPEKESIQLYLDKLIFLIIGIVVIYVSQKHIKYVQETEN